MPNNQRSHITGDGNQELQFLLFHKLAADPLVSHEAQFYYNTVDKTVKMFDSETPLVDPIWVYIPKITDAFTNPQVVVGDGFFIKPIVAPAGVHFLLVDSDSTPSFIDLNNIFTDNILNYNSTLLTYKPYTSKKGVDPVYPYFYTGVTTPTFTNRLNLDGKLYATAYNVAGGTPLKYYGTDANNNLVPMADPATQIQSDWNQTDNLLLDYIKNKPTVPIQYWQKNSGTLSPAISTDNIGIGISVSTATKLHILDNTISNVAIVKIYAASTAATGNAQKILDVQLSGVNTSAGQTTTAIFASNTHTGAVATNIGIRGEASNGTMNYGVYGLATVGVYGESIVASGVGVRGVSGSGSTARGILGVSTTGVPIGGEIISSSTDTILPIINATATSNGTSAAGFGASMEFYLESSTGSNRLSNYIYSKWVTATDASRTSEFGIIGVNNTTSATLFVLSGSGSVETLRGQYHYHSQVMGVDTAGDWRTYCNDRAFYTEYCTVGAATRGGGTWVIKDAITI